MPMYNLFTYEINLTLTWSEKYVLSNNTKVTTFAIIDIKIWNFQLELYQLKIMQNYCNNSNQVLKEKLIGKLSKVTIQAANPYSFLDWSKFSRSKLFFFSFKNKDDRTVHTKYNLSTVEIKVYNVMIDG